MCWICNGNALLSQQSIHQVQWWKICIIWRVFIHYKEGISHHCSKFQNFIFEWWWTKLSYWMSLNSFPQNLSLARCKEGDLPLLNFSYLTCQGRRRRGGAGGARASPLSKVGGHKWVCAPPLLGIANVLISLYAHILWLKIQFFSKFSWLASLANFNKSIFSNLS